MQIKRILTVAMLATLCFGFFASGLALAADKNAAKGAKERVYNEMEFLRGFSGKTRQQVSEILGPPDRREQSVKPSNAEYTVGRPIETSTPVSVEMWYYKKMVEYDKNKTYSMAELTFVNDHCANIAFFNNAP